VESEARPGVTQRQAFYSVMRSHTRRSEERFARSVIKMTPAASRKPNAEPPRDLTPSPQAPSREGLCFLTSAVEPFLPHRISYSYSNSGAPPL
jgi:hypothetical protein